MTDIPQYRVPAPSEPAIPQPGAARSTPIPAPSSATQPASPGKVPSGRADSIPQPAPASAPTQNPHRTPAGNRYAASGHNSAERIAQAHPFNGAGNLTGAPAPGQFTPSFRSFVHAAPAMPGPGAVQYPQAAPQAAQVWSVPALKRQPVPVFEAVVIGAGAALMLLGVFGFMVASGPVLTVFLAIMCIVPLSIVISVLQFIDRFEPEPWWTKIAAFLWGGGVAVFFAGMFNELSFMSFANLSGSDTAGAVFRSVVGAPLGEELLKALGVIAIVMLRRNNVSSPVDGLVYGGFSAAGFLVVEDFTYFVNSTFNGTLPQTYFIRVFLGVFGHVMYTSCTGWAIGWAVTRTRSLGVGCGVVTLGYLIGVTMHGTWNGSAAIVSSDGQWFVLYGVIQIPLFCAWLWFVASALKRERRDAAAGLMPYVRQGWIIPSEVQMTCESSSRRAALAWVSRGGPTAKRAMKEFMRSLASLGLNQFIMNVRGPEAKRIDATRETVQQATEHRAVFQRLMGVRVR